MSAIAPSISRPWFTPVVLGLVLFCSGLCSLIYQSVWLREFRLIFGGAAPAASAVLAVFMAGLGFGGAWFGARAERTRLPLKFYAFLEAGIALAACLTPFLLQKARDIYASTGGADSLGLFWATVLQIAVTGLVLGLPCFLMGGTLPVAMKFAQRRDDDRRSDTALFYGINVAGALAGAGLGTFAMLPAMGNRSTLMTAVLANAVIAVVAGVLSRLTEQKAAPEEVAAVPVVEMTVKAKAPGWFVLAAAFLSGFTFFVAELVWYRVATPLLGSTVFGFGLILCVVLAGIGLGGLIYSFLLRQMEPRLSGFTLISAMQAFFVLLPYALGDRVSYGALVINESLRGFGFGPLAAGWFGIIALLVFMPALLSGIQFPLLVSLLGKGNAGVGRELGRAYFWNTVGSISGSLLGGFVLVPMLSARTTWIVVAVLIGGMSALSFLLGRRNGEPRNASSWTSLLGLGACATMAMLATGPTAGWLQSPIGYGRLPDYPKDSLSLEQWTRNTRRLMVKAFDGRDANVAVVVGQDQHAFLTNGKSDGSALGDAATQVMFGLVGAIVHPRDVRECCVVGLGTGSTAGWLADLPSVKRVDAIEIESRAGDIAREFSGVNRRALDNPKVRLVVGDGREVLQSQGTVYDLIASEPSNPYRAGVANLYTQEFYQSAKRRLAPDGIFCQWLQGYETDPETIKLIISTLCSEFEKVEVWNTQGSDFLFVCSPQIAPWDVALVRQRLQQPIYAEACARLWHTTTAEGFFSRCLANALYSRFVTLETSEVNTDDRNVLEFAAARNMGRTLEEPLRHVFSVAAARKLDIPFIKGDLDKERLAYERCETFGERADMIDLVIHHAGEAAGALRAKKEVDAYANAEDYAGYLSLMGNRTPSTLSEQLTFAIATALTGDPRASAAAAALDKHLPDCGLALTAMRLSTSGKPDQEAQALCDALTAMRRSPWLDWKFVDWMKQRLVHMATREAPRNQRIARTLFDALNTPFEEGYFSETRNKLLTQLADSLSPAERLFAIEAWGPHYPFASPELCARLITYAEIDHPGLARARADLERFLHYGGHPPFTLAPLISALLNTDPGQEVALMKEYHKQQTAALSPAR